MWIMLPVKLFKMFALFKLPWKPVHSKMGWPRHGQTILWIIFTSFLLIICVTLTFKGHVWKMFDSNMGDSEYDDLNAGYGLRKLLEDPDAKFRQEGLNKRLPQCIIIGVRKCGTRALLELLNLHPNIKIAGLEMHFFDHDENYDNGYEWYRKYMPFSTSKDITIEKTPRYFISESAPERIFNFNSSIKLIVIFRHPTTRVISDFSQVNQNKLDKNKSVEPFEKIVIDQRTGQVNTGYKAVRISIYHNYLTQWLLYFPRQQIHIVNGDNLIANALEEVKKVETFLGLDHAITEDNVYFNETRGFYCMKSGNDQHCLGAQKGRKHPNIDPKVIRKLNDFYYPHNQKLFAMIDHKFDWD